MSRIEQLRQKVNDLYSERRPGRGDWADWLYENHVFQVADKAGEIAKNVGANAELAMAAAMLHDVGDAVISRFDSSHEETSIRIAREMMSETGFSEDEVNIVVEDAIKLHGCHDGKVPETLEGKVMASADAVVHLSTDFYDFGIDAMRKTKTPDEVKRWGLPKIERDFNEKIFFDDVREGVRKDYARAQKLFDF